MKAVLKDGSTRQFDGADIKEITVSVFGDVIVIVMHSGEVLMAKSIHAKE